MSHDKVPDGMYEIEILFKKNGDTLSDFFHHEKNNFNLLVC